MKLLVLFATLAVASAAVDSPRIGCLTDHNGSLRLVSGVRASFLVSPPLVNEVLAFSCDEDVLLVKTATALLALDQAGVELARVDSSVTKVLFAGLTALLDDETAFVFNKKEKAWNQVSERPPPPPPSPYSVRDGAIYSGETQSIPVPGHVRSIESMSSHWIHAVSDQGHFAVLLERGEIEVFALPLRDDQ